MKPATHKNRPEKKSETIEVRVSYTEKLAFMEACRQAGITASQAIRAYIGDFQNPDGTRKAKARLAAALIFVTLLTMAAGGAFLSQRKAGPVTTGERVMRYFDQDEDGVLTVADTGNSAGNETVQWLLETGDQNADGRITSDETNTLADVMIELRGTHPAGVNKGADEKVIIVPPGLTSRERQTFLEQAGLTETVSTKDQVRLQRLIDALVTPGEDDETAKHR